MGSSDGIDCAMHLVCSELQNLDLFTGIELTDGDLTLIVDHFEFTPR